MDIQSVALAAGLAWGSGIRPYAVNCSLAGLMARLGYVELPPGLGLLTHPAVLGASGFKMFFIEFFADKVPGFDTLWDAAHTFIRIPAGALLAALALADQDPALILAAAILGGTLASAVHLTKAGSRASSTPRPNPSPTGPPRSARKPCCWADVGRGHASARLSSPAWRFSCS